MTQPAHQELRERLDRYGQDHLLTFWHQLNVDEQQQLAGEIAQVDLDQVQNLFQQPLQADAKPIDWSLAQPAPAFRLLGEDHPDDLEAIRVGTEVLQANQVAVILVAGGQGSRLGFNQAKGLYPIGPVSGRSLLEVLLDRIEAIAERYQVTIPLFLMTSPDTHAPLHAFLHEHDRFQNPGTPITLFCQEQMPSVDRASGRILMKGPGEIALSPNGHGGMLAAFAEHGCLDILRQHGIQYLFYGQIDNPLLPICDPRLIGYHILAHSEMSTHVINKASAEERVGVGLLVDGIFRIIEYSMLPEVEAHRSTDDGELLFWAGSIGSHVFNGTLLERGATDPTLLPYHASFKNVPHLEPDGSFVQDEQLNGVKFERFIFDLAAIATNPIMVEINRNTCFAPVKNRNGSASDTPASAQQMMSNLFRDWLTDAGAKVNPGTTVEIHPRWALNAGDVAARLSPETRVDSPTYFHL